MQPAHKRKFQAQLPYLKRVGLVLLALCGVFFFGWCIWLVTSFGITPTIVLNLIRNEPTHVKQLEGRTNIVLLGIGGGNHEGADMTDTIQVVSLDLKHKTDHVMISLPRDIWIQSLKDKINSAYHYGEEKSPGGGFVLAKSIIEEVLGIPIHHAVLIDFTGFKQMIDTIGGIDVDIAEAFTDTQYPITGKEQDLCDGDLLFACRYESVTFSVGIEHMDGERALKFVRSRHAVGDAGNDFSRGKRQQAVFIATKNKLLTLEIYSNLTTLQKLKKTVSTSLTTDISFVDQFGLARMFLSGEIQIRTANLTQDLPENKQVGLLVNPPLYNYGGVWVLIPKQNNYTQIHEYIACVLKQPGGCEEIIESQSR